MKHAQRVLVEGNVFENIWTAAQSGRAFNFKASNEGSAPWTETANVTIRLNIIRNASGGLSIGNTSSNPSIRPHHFLIENNLWDNLDANEFGDGHRSFANIAVGSDHILVHNTALLTNGRYALRGETGQVPGLVFKNNIVSHGSNGADCSGSSSGTPALEKCYPGYIFTKNVLFDSPGLTEADYPPDNFLPPVAGVLFVNYNNGESGNYRLQASSPYKNAADDGKDIGADIDAIESATAGVVQ